jgi:acetyl-CoA decarbonylase/synthase complex subunit gamma
MTQKLMDSGLTDLVLDVGSGQAGEALSRLTQIRRSALKKTFRPLGFPTIAFAESDDPYVQISQASAYVAKYASIVVVSAMEPWQILPLLTVRQNIYTNPQKPIQVKPGIYAVGNVDENSPLLITTNFSLTYYTVEGDVEASRVPAYIAAIDTEGTSVLTAWAAEKMTVENVTQMLNQDGGAKDKVAHRKVIIPGLVAVMTAKLKEESGWDVLVGPKESSGIPKFLKSEWSI